MSHVVSGGAVATAVESSISLMWQAVPRKDDVLTEPHAAPSISMQTRVFCLPCDCHRHASSACSRASVPASSCYESLVFRKLGPSSVPVATPLEMHVL